MSDHKVVRRRCPEDTSVFRFTAALTRLCANGACQPYLGPSGQGTGRLPFGGVPRQVRPQPLNPLGTGSYEADGGELDEGERFCVDCPSAKSATTESWFVFHSIVVTELLL